MALQSIGRWITIIAGISAALVVACSGGSDIVPTRDPNAPPHIPDIDNGQRLFGSESCSACHSTASRRITGPGLAGIGDRAASRRPGLSADEYIEQSIRDPGAFVVPGFSNLMPTAWKRLPQDDIDDLIVYLKSLN